MAGIIIWRTFLFYVVLLISVRVMGKREIGALDPFDFVVAILLAELAAIPIQNLEHPSWTGVLAIGVLVALQMISSWLCLVNDKARKFISGHPTVVVRHGQLMEQEMRRHRYNIHDLLAQLRLQGVPDVTDVETAVLENNGQLSVVPRSQKRPLTPEDLQVATPYEALPVPVVLNGKINYHALHQHQIEYTWLQEKLREQGVENPATLFYAHLDTQGNLYVQRRAGAAGGTWGRGS